MKKPLETARRWLGQAEHDLAMAKRLQEESPADACYFAEQAAQKGLKAFLYRHGSRGQPEHSIGFLTRKCGEFDPSFTPRADLWQMLDQYYVATRYPDAVADPAMPFEIYSVAQAAEAIHVALEVLESVRVKV